MHAGSDSFAVSGVSLPSFSTTLFVHVMQYELWYCDEQLPAPVGVFVVVVVRVFVDVVADLVEQLNKHCVTLLWYCYGCWHVS